MMQDVNDFCRRRRSLFYPKADLPPCQSTSTDCPGQDVAWLRCKIRALGGPGAVAVVPLESQGTYHRLFRILFNGLPAWVARVSRLPGGQPDFPMLLDAWADRRLRSNGIPVPGVRDVDLSRTVVPCDIEILEEAPGLPLAAYDSDETGLELLLFELGKVVGRLHNISGERYGLIDLAGLVQNRCAGRLVGLHAHWGDYLRLRLGDHLQTCLSISAITEFEAREIDQLFVDRDCLLQEVPAVLLHGDLGSHNVFTDGREITALIDWEDALIGDPVYDIAFWATFHPDRRHQAFVAGYRSVAVLPGDFARRFWLYYLRVAIAKTVLRHRLGIPDRPGRAPAAERIQRALRKLQEDTVTMAAA